VKKTVVYAVGFAVLFAGLAQAAVVLTPFRLEETRSVALVEDSVGRATDALKVTLSLKGPEADAGERYGKLKLDEAVDDKGTNLIPEKDSFNEAEKFKEYSNAFFRKFDIEQKKPATAPQIELTLKAPKRAATKIARLRGSFMLAQAGTLKTVTLACQKTAGKKKMDIPATAGIGITVIFKAATEGNSVGLEITGDETAMESIEVLDAEGKTVSNGMSSWSMGGVVSRSLDLEKPLDDSMKVVAKIAMDRKFTKIAFDLKDVALP